MGFENRFFPESARPIRASATSANLAREWVNAQSSVAAFIQSLVHNFSEAEELLQETAAQIFGHVERFDDSRPFLPFALGVAKNVVLRHRRRSGRLRLVFDPQVIERLEQAFIELAPARELLAEALQSCREKLSDRDQRICRMRYEEALPPAEISQRLGVSPGSVRVLLHRIREQLRTCVEHRMKTEGGFRE